MTDKEREDAIRFFEQVAEDEAMNYSRLAIEALKDKCSESPNGSDLISRQAAIDAVHKNYDTILDFKSDGRTVADSFEDVINALPPAQPDNRLERIADIVEGTIDHLDRDDAMDMLYQIKEVLK